MTGKLLSENEHHPTIKNVDMHIHRCSAKKGDPYGTDQIQNSLNSSRILPMEHESDSEKKFQVDAMRTQVLVAKNPVKWRAVRPVIYIVTDAFTRTVIDIQVSRQPRSIRTISEIAALRRDVRLLRQAQKSKNRNTRRGALHN